MVRLLDCRGISSRYFEWVAGEVAAMKRKPHLATVLFRPKQNPASLQYRDLILKDAARLGVSVDGHEAQDEKSLLALVRRLNADSRTTGMMLFYPLKCRLNDEDVMDLVSPLKDVEGLHSVNLGYLVKYKRFLDEAKGIKCVVPATAKAVVKTLLHYPEIKIEGAFAVVINNSMRVGKPLGLMLENLGATVMKCYDKTPQEVLEQSVRRADIVVTAVPDPSFRLEASWIKKGAVVVDVSYQGNIDMKAAASRASFLTASDNRIGSVTRAMTFINLVYCAKNAPLRRSARVPVLG
jgi:5,10-methylene-tetrahydrofolate dehydrogenase/methenyl tetrahydrofolate cyclohydrolase